MHFKLWNFRLRRRAEEIPLERFRRAPFSMQENGFPLRPRTSELVTQNLEFFKKWPENGSSG
jgi:hypothetical protein